MCNHVVSVCVRGNICRVRSLSSTIELCRLITAVGPQPFCPIWCRENTFRMRPLSSQVELCRAMTSCVPQLFGSSKCVFQTKNMCRLRALSSQVELCRSVSCMCANMLFNVREENKYRVRSLSSTLESCRPIAAFEPQPCCPRSCRTQHMQSAIAIVAC